MQGQNTQSVRAGFNDLRIAAISLEGFDCWLSPKYMSLYRMRSSGTEYTPFQWEDHNPPVLAVEMHFVEAHPLRALDISAIKLLEPSDVKIELSQLHQERRLSFNERVLKHKYWFKSLWGHQFPGDRQQIMLSGSNLHSNGKAQRSSKGILFASAP